MGKRKAFAWSLKVQNTGVKEIAYLPGPRVPPSSTPMNVPSKVMLQRSLRS